MTTIEKLIAKYTGRDIDLRTRMAAAPRLAELLWRTGHSLESTEDELRQHVRILHEAATKIGASMDSEPASRCQSSTRSGKSKATAAVSTC